MTAAGFDVLDVETKNLPEGFNRLCLPGAALDSSEQSGVDSSDEATGSEEPSDEVGLAASAA